MTPLDFILDALLLSWLVTMAIHITSAIVWRFKMDLGQTACVWAGAMVVCAALIAMGYAK